MISHKHIKALFNLNRARVCKFSSGKVGDRESEVKGAMNDFLNKSKGPAESMWTRLKKDVAPAPSSATSVPRNSGVASGAASPNVSAGMPSFRPRRVLDKVPKTALNAGQSSRPRDLRDSAERPGGERFTMPKPSTDNAQSSSGRSFRSLDDYLEERDTKRGTKRPSFEDSDEDEVPKQGRRRILHDDDQDRQEDEFDEKDGDDDDAWGGAEQGIVDEDEEVDLAPEDKDLIFDDAYWKAFARKGGRIDTSEMDLVDSLMATAFIESFKSDSGAYHVVTESTDKVHVTVPKPRTMNQLMHAMESDVRCSEPGSAGHALGVQAWEVVNRNLHYTDAQKYELADLVAENKVQVDKYAREDHPPRPLQDPRDQPSCYDGIFTVGFRRGVQGIDAEARRRERSSGVVQEDLFAQAATDWDVEAVVDEDQL